MARRGEAAQIRADLSEEDLGRAPADAWNGLQPLLLGLKRAQAVSDLSADALQTGIEEVDVGQLLGDQEALMCAELAGERLLQLGDLLTQSPARQLGEGSDVGGSRDQRLQDIAPRLAPTCPDLPRMSVATDASLIVAPSSTFCSRLTSLARSWMSVVR